MKYSYILLIIIPVVLFSCKKRSQKLEASEVYQSYTMSYDENDDKTTYTVMFRKKDSDGKIVKLTKGANVSVDGHTMERNGINYTHSISGLDTLATFIFTDNDGNIYTNEVTDARYIGNDYHYYIPKSSSFYWDWLGAEIWVNESVELDFRSNVDDGTGNSYSSAALWDEEITISATSMTDITVGEANAEIRRVYTNPTGEFSAAGGIAKSEFIGLTNIVEFY